MDLELSGDKIKTDRLEKFAGKIGDNEVNGKLNGGGVPCKSGSRKRKNFMWH